MVQYTELPMAIAIRFVFLLSIVVLQTILEANGQAVTTARARRLPEFDGKVIPSTRLLWTKQERHATFCVAECARDVSCISAFYTKTGGQCQGHSNTFWDTGEAADLPDTKFFVLPRGESYIGDRCTTLADCTTPNAQCFNSSCLCKHGYSLKPTTYECLQDCTVYGNDFMEVKNFYISGTNLYTQNQTTFAECKNLCRARADFLCRSFEYMWSAQRCFLTNVTYYHHPDRWYADVTGAFDISYFQRDCEQ